MARPIHPGAARRCALDGRAITLQRMIEEPHEPSARSTSCARR